MGNTALRLEIPATAYTKSGPRHDNSSYWAIRVKIWLLISVRPHLRKAGICQLDDEMRAVKPGCGRRRHGAATSQPQHHTPGQTDQTIQPTDRPTTLPVVLSFNCLLAVTDSPGGKVDPVCCLGCPSEEGKDSAALLATLATNKSKIYQLDLRHCSWCGCWKECRADPEGQQGLHICHPQCWD